MSSKVAINRWLVLINSGSAVLTYVLNGSVMLWAHQYLLRRISVGEYSIYPVVIGVVAFVPLFTAILLGGLGRYAVEASARSDDKRLTEIVSTMVPLLAAGGVALLIPFALAAWHVDDLLTIPGDRVTDARLMLVLLAASAAVRGVLTPFGLGLFVRQKFVSLNLIRLSGQVLRLAILLVLLLGVSPRILWVVVAAVVADTATVVVVAIVSRRLIPALRFQRGAFRWSVARQITSFGTWNAVMQLGDLVRTSAQPLILNLLGTPLDVACFGVALVFAVEIQRITIAVSIPLQPPLTAMFAAGDREGLRKAYLRGNRYALWAVMLMVAPLIIFRTELITLYAGEKYLLAAVVLALLVAPVPLRFANMMLSLLATASARMRPQALGASAIQAAALVLTLVLVGGWGLGAWGAAVAGLVASVIGVPLLLWPLGWRMSGASPRQWLHETVGPGIAPCLAGVPIWLALHWLVGPASWVSLCACVAAGVAGYVALLVLFCLRPHEREDLRRILKTIRSPRSWKS